MTFEIIKLGKGIEKLVSDKPIKKDIESLYRVECGVKFVSYDDALAHVKRCTSCQRYITGEYDL